MRGVFVTNAVRFAVNFSKQCTKMLSDKLMDSSEPDNRSLRSDTAQIQT